MDLARSRVDPIQSRTKIPFPIARNFGLLFCLAVIFDTNSWLANTLFVATNMQQMINHLALRHLLSANNEQEPRENEIRYGFRMSLRTQPNTVAFESIFSQEEYFSIHTILNLFKFLFFFFQFL